MNDKLLNKFLWGFYGYGDWTAPIWFLGMEEAGGENVEEVDRRLDLWNSKGQPDLLDVHDLLEAVGNVDWIGEGNDLQPTWAGLIRLLLSAQGKDTGNNTVRRFQGDVWGRTGSKTCAIELFPLPSPSIGAWNYRDWSNSPHLVNRTVYRHSTFSYRARQIGERIKEYRPKAVVCYGTTYHDYWEGISGGSIEKTMGKAVRHAERGGTHWFVVPHPVARGVTPSDFVKAGELVSKTVEFWVFAYGSLMTGDWAEPFAPIERSKAKMAGIRRSFSKASTKNWGSRECPAPTLTLEESPGGVCMGIAFCFPSNQRTKVEGYLEEREGRSAVFVRKPLFLSDGRHVDATTAIFDKTAKSHLGKLTAQQCADMARRAKGEKGSGVDYVKGVYTDLLRLEIEDSVVTELWNLLDGKTS